MNKKIKTLMNLVSVLLILLVTGAPLSAAYYQPDVVAKSSILVNADSGMIVTGHDIDKQVGIASITKLMTVYVILDELKENDIPKSEMVTISERAAKLKAESPDASGVWYNAGEQVSIDELLHLGLIYSDNTAMIAMAEHLSGSEQKHVDLMNKKAKELGMTNTVYYNVSGLTMEDYGSIQVPGTKPSDYNKSSTRDQAIMIQSLLEEYPEVLKITSQETVTHGNETLNTWNLMLPGQLMEYDGVTGLKTGTSNEAGACFAGYYTDENGRKFISLVLGATDGNERFNQTAVMYNWENGLKYNTFIPKKTTQNFAVAKSVKGKYDLHPQNDVELVDGTAPQLVLEKIEYNKDYFKEDKLTKEVPKGKPVLYLDYRVINDEEESIQYVNSKDNYLRVPMVADTEIKTQSEILTFVSAIPSFIEDLFANIL